MKRVGDLQLEQELAFERRSWRVQRVIQVFLAFFVLAAIAGFFGSGPVSRATARDPAGALTVEYPRFARRHGPAEMTITVRPRPDAPEIVLWLESPFADAFRWESATPEPAEMELRDGRVLLRFSRTGGDVPARIVIHLQPQRLGSIAARVGLIGGPEATLHVFNFP